MKQARIFIDERAYQGEDLTQEEPSRGGLSNGWQSHNSGALDGLKFGDEPVVIVSNNNIKSHLDRILARIRNGTLDATRIVIELEDAQV